MLGQGCFELVVSEVDDNLVSVDPQKFGQLARLINNILLRLPLLINLILFQVLQFDNARIQVHWPYVDIAQGADVLHILQARGIELIHLLVLRFNIGRDLGTHGV